MIVRTRIDDGILDARKAFAEQADQIKEALREDARTDAVGERENHRESAVAIAKDKVKGVMLEFPVTEWREEAARMERGIARLRQLAGPAGPESNDPDPQLPKNPMVGALTGCGVVVVGSALHLVIGLTPAILTGLVGLAGLCYLGISGATAIRIAIVRFKLFAFRQEVLREISTVENQLSNLTTRVKTLETIQKDADAFMEAFELIYDREYALARHALNIAKQSI